MQHGGSVIPTLLLFVLLFRFLLQNLPYSLSNRPIIQTILDRLQTQEPIIRAQWATGYRLFVYIFVPWITSALFRAFCLQLRQHVVKFHEPFKAPMQRLFWLE